MYYGNAYFGTLLAALCLLVLFLVWRALQRSLGFPGSLRELAAFVAFAAPRLGRRDWTNVRPFLAIVKRELLTSLRLRRTYGLLVVSVGVVFMVVFSRVPTLTADRAAQANAALWLFGLYAATVYYVGCIFVPLLAGPAISMEHQRHTLEMLSATMIGPRTIVYAKLVNVLGVYLLVMVATLPVIGVLFFFTGIGLGYFLLTFIGIMFKIFAIASVGLLCSSAFHRSTVVAIGATYLLLPFVMFGWLLALILSVICLRKAAGFVHRPPSLPALEMPALIKDPALLRARREQWPYYLIDPLRPKKPIPDAVNPMFAKENRTGLLRQGSWRIRVFYGYMTLFIFIPFLALEGGRQGINNSEIAVSLYIETLLILLVTPAAISASFAKEYEIGHLDMLRMTVLRPRQIVLGKFLSAAVLVTPLVVASVAGMVLMMPATGAHRHLAALGLGYASMVATLVFALSVGAVVSVCSRQTTVALVAGYAANLVLLLGLPYAGALLEQNLAFTPLSMLMVSAGKGFDVARDWPGWLSNLALSTAVAAMLLSACVMVFQRRWMQDK